MQDYPSTTAAGRAVSLRFPRFEHEARIAAARARLRDESLDALLIFAQESHLYLTGYDTAGYVFFQCGILTAADGPLLLLTRRPDLVQALDASLYDDVQLWFNAEDANPAQEIARMLAGLGLPGRRIGVELATYGLTAANFQLLSAALQGHAELVDASQIVRALRLIKSPAELAYVRHAALADDAVRAMIAAARPGALDRRLMQATVPGP